jgi:hydroxymethylpyrimidine pyrophosphatase-like HAD family hydrolase
VWCLDIDGTLTAPGKELAPAILALLNSIRDHVVLITAQAMDYCDTIHASSFPNLVTEKGMVRRINGTMRTEDASPEVPGFIQEMRELLGKIVDRNPTLVPVFNVKTAGYAVGDENLTTEERVRVLTLMQAQEGRANSELYIVEQTAGFIDITFARLSKASSLREVSVVPTYRPHPLTPEQAMTQFPGGTPIACGDSANTDGPMLDEAEKLGGTGIMVSKTRAGFVTVADHNKMIEVLRLYGEIVSA